MTEAKQKRDYPAVVYSKDATTTVNSDEEFSALNGKWYDTPADVPELAKQANPVTGQVMHAEYNAKAVDEAALPAPIGPGAVTRDHLLFEAETVGLTVDKRWSNETLRRMIFEHASA